MEKLLKYFLLIAILPMFVLVSCEKDDPDPDPPVATSFEVLKGYMVAQNLDLNNMLDGWIITAGDVHGKGIGDYYIMDIRSSGDFDTLGHIEGAVNSTLGGIVEDAANATKPILVVCYTGQSAGHALIALRLSGYTDAKSLKFGMSSWNDHFAGPWNNNTGNEAIGNSNWATPPGDISDPVVYADEPNFISSFTSGEDILKERVDYMLANGFQGIVCTDVLANPTNYYINNYWAEGDVELYGNIKSAYRINPLTLAGEEYKNLDVAEVIVTYCWTGQTSSMITAYLNVMGYNAKSLKFGSNAMIHDNLLGHKWTTDTPKDYEYLTTK
ncbi:MAG: rhodanese-like domain-containing protein [Bacteroidales bacterium]|nr:rhodanese-like domain-containing protein [Bacteroidales bacterium]